DLAGVQRCGGAAAERLAGAGRRAGAGGGVPAGAAALRAVFSGFLGGRRAGLGHRAAPVRADLPPVCRRRRAVRFGVDALFLYGVSLNAFAADHRQRGVTALDTLRSIALGVCVLCAAGGVIQIFWPENGYKPVINTVLVLYIVTSVLQMRGTAGGR